MVDLAVVVVQVGYPQWLHGSGLLRCHQKRFLRGLLVYISTHTFFNNSHLEFRVIMLAAVVAVVMVVCSR
jgi:hypothetical protein